MLFGPVRTRFSSPTRPSLGLECGLRNDNRRSVTVLGNLRRTRDAIGAPASVIGEDAEFNGELSGQGHVLVKGAVDGDSDLSGPVTIAPSGRWKGRLRAADVIIAGTVDGDIEASGKAEIRPTARVTGSVSAAQIAIGEGARVDGKLSTLSPEDIKSFAEKRSAGD